MNINFKGQKLEFNDSTFLNDKIANAVLSEEITQLDEFAIIRRTFSKLKSMGKKVIVWENKENMAKQKLAIKIQLNLMI